MTESPAKIFIVEDEALIAMELEDRVREFGYVFGGSASKGEEAVTSVPRVQPDLVLMDIHLAGQLDGVDAAARIRGICDVPVIFLTAFADQPLVDRAREVAPYGYIIKPFDERSLQVTIDMALRKHRLERRLSLSERRFRSIVEASPDAVYVLEKDGRIAAANAAGVDLYSRVSLAGPVGCRLSDSAGGEEREELEQMIAVTLEGQANELEYSLAGPEGDRWVQARMAPMLSLAGEPQVLALLRDVTERRELERNLRRSQRLESLGTLSAGIAHEFNNLLMAMLGHVELALDDIGADHPAVEWVGNLRDTVRHGADLVSQIKAFGTIPGDARDLVDLPALANAVVQTVGSTVPASVRMSVADTGCPCVNGDDQQLYRVILSLVTNAWHALPESGGNIQVNLRSCRLQSELSTTSSMVLPGYYAVVSVADDGTGIAPKHLDRIFDPFFTTKPIGKGWGLGLSAVHGIVTGLGGGIQVRSEAGQGATFEIYLPAAEDDESPSVEAGAEPCDGQGRGILLVGARDRSLAEVNEILTTAGFLVVWQQDPCGAISLLREEGHQFDLLIADQSLAAGPDADFVEQIDELRPGLPVVVIAGFLEEGKSVLDREKAGEVLYKPLSAADLMRAVERQLGPSEKPKTEVRNKDYG